mgnify:CR=1 FL=1
MVMAKFTKPLESATRTKINNYLINLGWEIDESSPNCNCFTERARTVEENSKFKGNKPDYVLYSSNTFEPIAIIEAKKIGESLDKALEQGITKYAKPLGIKIVFIT